MYWYYKVPLIVLLIMIVLGLGVLGWRGFVSPRINRTPAPAAETEPLPQAPSLPPKPVETQPAPPVEEKAAPKPVATVAAQPVPSDTEKILDEAEKAMLADNPRRARELAASVLKSDKCKEYDKIWMRAAEIIDSANRIFMNGKAPCPEKKTYIVASGDNLTRVAYRNNSTVGGLQRLNDLNRTSSVIHPGDALQYISGKWSIRVSKSHFLLMLLLDGELYRIYQISTGRQDRTPAGTFIIKDKAENPAWTPPGQSIPYGDPRNILGTRWMGLRPQGETEKTLSGYGIHGTTEPDTIGTAASLGCVRMRNEEVEELYDFIPLAFEKQRIEVVIEE